MRVHIALAVLAFAWTAPTIQAEPPAAPVPPVAVPVGPLSPAVGAPVVPNLPLFAAQPAGQWQPVLANISRSPSLGDLVLVKLDVDDDGASLIMMIEAFRQEKQTVTVTKFVTETREQTIEVDGKQRTVTYPVRVPFTEESEVTVNVPAGRKPMKVDAKDFQFFDLSAEPMSIDAVAKRLTALRPIFLIDQNTNHPLPLAELAKRAIHEDCVIAVTKKKIREYAHSTAWPAAHVAPAAPALPVLPNLAPPQQPNPE